MAVSDGAANAFDRESDTCKSKSNMIWRHGGGFWQTIESSILSIRWTVLNIRSLFPWLRTFSRSGHLVLIVIHTVLLLRDTCILPRHFLLTSTNDMVVFHRTCGGWALGRSPSIASRGGRLLPSFPGSASVTSGGGPQPLSTLWLFLR